MSNKMDQLSSQFEEVKQQLNNKFEENKSILQNFGLVI